MTPVLCLDAMPDGQPRPEFRYAPLTAAGCPLLLPSGRPVHLIRDREHVIKVVSDPRLTVAVSDGLLGNAARDRLDFIVLDNGFRRYKRPIGPLLAGPRLAAESPRIAAIAHQVAAMYAPPADLTQFVDEYIGRVVTMTMGRPHADWADYIFGPVYIDALNVPLVDEAAWRSVRAAWDKLYGYCAVVIEDARKGGRPGQSLLGALITDLYERGFTDEEAVHTVSVVIGGLPSPFGVMARTLAEMLCDPARITRCVTRPERWLPWLTEIMHGPAHFTVGNVRQGLEDVQVGPLRLKAGDCVIPSWTGAIQDPAAQPRMPVTRSGAFGLGPHRCPSSEWSVRVMLEGIGAYFSLHPRARLSVPFRDLTWAGPGLLPSPASLPVRILGDTCHT